MADLSPVLSNLSERLALTVGDLHRLVPGLGTKLEQGIEVLRKRRWVEPRGVINSGDCIYSITAEGVAVSASENTKKLTPRKRLSTIPSMVETTIDINIALKAVETSLAISLTDLARRLSVPVEDLRPVMATLAHRRMVIAKALPGDDDVIYHITADGVRELAEQEQRSWRARL